MIVFAPHRTGSFVNKIRFVLNNTGFDPKNCEFVLNNTGYVFILMYKS